MRVPVGRENEARWLLAIASAWVSDLSDKKAYKITTPQPNSKQLGLFPLSSFCRTHAIVATVPAYNARLKYLELPSPLFSSRRITITFPSSVVPFLHMHN